MEYLKIISLFVLKSITVMGCEPLSVFIIRKSKIDFSEQRNKYYHHRSKANSSPEKYMFIIIDGMDTILNKWCHF